MPNAKKPLAQKFVELVNGDQAHNLPSHLYKKWQKVGLLGLGISPQRPTTDLTHRCEWTYTPGPNFGQHECAHGWRINGYEWKRAVRYQGDPEVGWDREAGLPINRGIVPQKVGEAYYNGLRGDQPCTPDGTPLTDEPNPDPQHGPAPMPGQAAKVYVIDDPVQKCYVCPSTDVAYQGASGQVYCTYHGEGMTPIKPKPWTGLAAIIDDAPADPAETGKYHECPVWKEVKLAGPGVKQMAQCADHAVLITWSRFIKGKKAAAKMHEQVKKAADKFLAEEKAKKLAAAEAALPPELQKPMPVKFQGDYPEAGAPAKPGSPYVVTPAGAGMIGNPHHPVFGTGTTDYPAEVAGYWKDTNGPAIPLHGSVEPVASWWYLLGQAVADGKPVYAPDWYCEQQGWITKAKPQKVKPKQMNYDPDATAYVMLAYGKIIPFYGPTSNVNPNFLPHSKHGTLWLYAHKEAPIWKETV